MKSEKKIGPIQWVVFDFGNVISIAHDKTILAAMAKRVGADYSKFHEAYFAFRQEYDSGSLDASAYYTKVAESIGLPFNSSLTDELLLLDIKSWHQCHPEMVAWIRSLLARGYGCAILSNMPHEHCWHFRKEFPLVNEMSPLLLSAEIALCKPDPAIYRHLVAATNAAPHAHLFLDDREDNVAGALSVGLNALQFNSSNDILKQIDTVERILQEVGKE